MRFYVDLYSTHFSTTVNTPESVLTLVDIEPFLNFVCVKHFTQNRCYTGTTKYYHEENRETFRFPRYFLNKFIKYFKPKFGNLEIIKHDPIPKRSINIKIKDTFKDRPEHDAALKHLMNCSYTMRMNNLQTGMGKTYCGIKTITWLDGPAIIMCDGLFDQWIQSFLKFTTVQKSDIHLLCGFNSILDLFEKDLRPKIIIASIPTLRNYVNHEQYAYTQLPTLTTLLEIQQTHVKLWDEAHLNFAFMIKCDLISNVAHNLYLTATPRRNSHNEQQIYSTAYPPSIIGGGNTYHRYVDITMVLSNYPVRANYRKYVSTKYGYNNLKFEGVILNTPDALRRWDDDFVQVFRQTYLQHNEPGTNQCLIYISTKRMAEHVKRMLADVIAPLYDTRTYLSEDPIFNLQEADICICTPKSCGTGKDLPRLVTIINTISTQAETTIEQMLGRIRFLGEHQTYRFADITNATVPEHCRHRGIRRAIYQRCAKEFFVWKL